MKRWFSVWTFSLTTAFALGCTAPPRDAADDSESTPAAEAETESGAELSAPPAPRQQEAQNPKSSSPAARPKSETSSRVEETKGASESPPPRIVEVAVPAGTVLELELLTALDSSVNRVGDEIQARTLSPLYVDGELVLGSGALVQGKITEAKASGKVKGRAQLGFTFDRLRTPTGLEKIQTSYVEREAESGQKKDAAIIGGAAGVGAIVGGIIGGKKGAAIGATVGGAGGTGVVLSTKGEEIRIASGTEINVRLDQPVTIAVN